MILYGIGDTFRTGTHKAMIFEWLRLQGRSDERTSIYGFTRSWSQIGSALSGIIAAAFVLFSGSYAYVFYFAVIPYVLNLVNLATYPKALDGEHQKARTVRESMSRLWGSLKKSLTDRSLRRLISESMGWEGVFGAVKDYLQPILQSLAIITLVAFYGSGADGTTESPLNDAQTTALLIGPVYAVLFLMSAWASRNSHRLVERAGNEHAASRSLWAWNLLTFLTIAVAAWFQWNLVLVAAFVLLHLLKNFWRPILITRFDSHSNPEEGATILSIESQAQRLSTFIVAPILGWCVDFVRGQELGGGEFWPIGILGAVIALLMFVSSNRTGGTSSSQTSNQQ